MGIMHVTISSFSQCKPINPLQTVEAALYGGDSLKRRVMGKEDAQEGTGKILWLFPRLRFSNQEPKKPNVKVREEVKPPKNLPPRSVYLGSRQTSLPPLEAQEVESVGRTSNPAILWQVYVLSGFLVLKWMWTRWKERKEGGDEKGSSDDDHSPADDGEYSHFSDGMNNP